MNEKTLNNKKSFKEWFSKEKMEVTDEGKLYPKKLSSKEMEPYNDQLNQIVVDKKVKNVAITGPYGIGKSSVLETYFQNNNLKERSIFVNLPDFWQVKSVFKGENIDIDGENGHPPKNKGEKLFRNSDIDESILQKKILEQIIFDSKTNVPFMTMRKSNTISFFKILIFLIMCFIILPSLVSSFSNWNWNYSWFKSLSLWELLTNTIALLFIGYVVWKLINLIKISKISVKIFGQGIAFEEKNELPFSKYAEELIAFFKYSKIEYIVIEDLDRYEYTSIYKELRDLNQLINRSLSRSKRVVFLYALRDTLITEENEKSSVETKAKFFDYVIPILSNTSFNNGFEAINKELESIKIDKGKESKSLNSFFEEKDLRLLGYYLNGQRVIKLIAAETKQVLKRILDSSSCKKDNIEEILEYEKISAKEIIGSVIYKNFYPKEYEESKNHNSDIDQLNDSLQSIVFKMNAEITKIKIRIYETNGSINDFKNVAGLTSQELKKKILEDFLKSFKEKNVYFIVKNSWFDLNLNDINTAYERLSNKMDEIDSESIVFYKNRSVSASSQIKTITKSNLKKGEFKFSYEDFEDYETVDDQITEWKQHVKILEERQEFLEKQNDFSIVFAFMKEKDGNEDYTHIENEELKNSLKEIEKDKLKDQLLSNGFVTVKFNDILSSFANSKLNGNDREIIENVTLGNTIKFDQTVNNPEEVVQELNRIDLDYTLIYSYRIAEYLHEFKNTDKNFNLILNNWRSKRYTRAGYKAFEEESYDFFNCILNDWRDGLLDERGYFLDISSFLLMIVNENVKVELVKQPYMKALNDKKGYEALNEFITNQPHLVEELFKRLNKRIKLSNISIFDFSTLQQMVQYDLFSRHTENVIQLVNANIKNLFNFGNLGRFFSDFDNTPLVSSLLEEKSYLVSLIEDLNKNANEVLMNEESIENFGIFIEILQERTGTSSFLILEVLEQAKLADLKLSVEEKRKLTERSEIQGLASELDDENSQMISSFVNVVHKRILYYQHDFVEWFKLVGIEEKTIILKDIIDQYTNLDEIEAVINNFVDEDTLLKIPTLINLELPMEINYVLLKMYSQKWYFEDNLAKDVIKETADYVIENGLKDEELYKSFTKSEFMPINKRVQFGYKLLTEHQYSIIDIAEDLNIKDEIQLVINEKKNTTATWTYTDSIYIVLKILEKMNLTHSLIKKKGKIEYRLKREVNKYLNN